MPKRTMYEWDHRRPSESVRLITCEWAIVSFLCLYMPLGLIVLMPLSSKLSCGNTHFSLCESVAGLEPGSASNHEFRGSSLMVPTAYTLITCIYILYNKTNILYIIYLC